MAESRYVSDIQYIDHNNEVIFNYLSNFQNLSKYLTEDILEQLAEKVPQVKIQNFQSDADSCSFSVSGFGNAEIRIVEREPYKTIKVEGQGGFPIELTFWVQLLPVDAYKTKLRLTLHTEMGMMVKMMVGNKLEKGINQLAETLARLPYA
jgi:carbon monoxide dehydrogenase subunit G